MIRLSYSALETLNLCERKFQLERLLVGNELREESEHLSFGAAYGAGVQSYLTNQDPDAALYAAWLAYWPIVESDKKDQARCMVALLASFPTLDNLLLDYEVVEFAGRPATELSFRLDIDATYYFVGYIDVVLRGRFDGLYTVLEIKTTGLGLTDLSPLYMHSGQALGYSICLDRIAGQAQSSYRVLYLVAQLGKAYNQIQPRLLAFDKTLLDRLNWFITLGLDVKHLHEMAELGSYPMRGSACLNFMRPCKFFGSCQLHSLDQDKVQEPDEVDYQFVYDLDALIEDHLIRVHSSPAPLLESPAPAGMYG